MISTPDTHNADSAGADGARALLRFGAVDYLGEVWLNGQYLGLYESGERDEAIE